MKKISLILCLLLFQYGYAQFGDPPQNKGVGINTTDPQETLHVNGKIRVTDTDFDDDRTMVSVIGIDDEGTLNKLSVGNGVVMVNNNTIISAGSGYYSIINYTLVTPSSNTQFNNLDVGLAGDYLYKTVIRFTGQTNSFQITGITGGFAGKHIILVNPSASNMKLLDEDRDSSAENRILTYGPGPAETLSGQGAIELVHDGYQWIVLNVRE